MKIFCAMLALLSVGAVSLAQEQPPRLQIGTTWVWLGMPKSELQGKFPDFSTATMKSGIPAVHKLDQHFGATGMHDESIWMIGSEELPDGIVEFTDEGIAKFASREWLVHGSDAVEAFLGVMESFTQQGLTACVISHSTNSDPSVHSEDATIQCGARRIHISRRKRGVSERKLGEYQESVSEEIGQWN